MGVLTILSCSSIAGAFLRAVSIKTKISSLALISLLCLKTRISRLTRMMVLIYFCTSPNNDVPVCLNVRDGLFRRFRRVICQNPGAESPLTITVDYF